MWNYEKRLQFPVKIKETNANIAQVIISQFGGPDGELLGHKTQTMLGFVLIVLLLFLVPYHQ